MGNRVRRLRDMKREIYNEDHEAFRSSVREFLDSLDGVDYVESELRRFGNPELFLMNVNSPEDLDRARAGVP